MTPINRGAGRRVVVGLDLGGTKMLGILMDDQARVRLRLRRPTPIGSNTAVREGVLSLVSELLQAGRDAGDSPAGIAIGAPGFIHPETGAILDAQNLGVHNLPLREIVAQTFGLPTRVLHDVKAAALGEARFGAGAQARHLAFLNIGTGVAVGLILRGQVYSGAAGRAGEIGHVCMQRDGPACVCGRRGCLEALASGPAIVRQAQAAIARNQDTAIFRLADGDASQITAETVAEAARQSDDLALALIAEAADYLGLAVAGLINVLDLECVIIGGGLSQMGDLFLDPIRAAAAGYVLAEYRETVPILPPALGADAGAVGAAAALIENWAE
jgi:glucokinase